MLIYRCALCGDYAAYEVVRRTFKCEQCRAEIEYVLGSGNGNGHKENPH